jgi:predicted ArsR family transcriptional regulator
VSDELDTRLESVGVLAEPVRRALYRYVVGQPGAVSRDEAADAVALPRHTVKFHLDRLVEGGLLDVEFRRLTGRSGPGAGRPSKLYRRAAQEVSVSLPERRYDLVGEVLADAVDRSLASQVPVADTLHDAAHEHGRRLVERFREQQGQPSEASEEPGPTRPAPAQAAPASDPSRSCAADLLAGQGYEPRTTPEGISLANCPFDRLAEQHTALVCGLNLALIEGVVDGLGATGLTPELAPAPGFCCVRIRG